MAQTFEWPNLMEGSRSSKLYFATSEFTDTSVPMSDEIVGDYQRVTLSADAKSWTYLYMRGIYAVGDVPEGTKLAISIFARVNGDHCSLTPTLRMGNYTGLMHGDPTVTRTNVGGGWTHCASIAARNSTAYAGQVFFIGIGLLNAGATIDIAQPMVCVSDEPHAWAPAAGEVWPE